MYDLKVRNLSKTAEARQNWQENTIWAWNPMSGSCWKSLFCSRNGFFFYFKLRFYSQVFIISVTDPFHGRSGDCLRMKRKGEL